MATRTQETENVGYPLNHPIVQTAIAKGLIRPEQLRGIVPETTPTAMQKRKPKLVEASFTPPGVWVIPLHVVAGDNQRGRAKIARAGHERRVVCRTLARRLRELATFADAVAAGLVIRVRLTRLGGRALDSDNAIASLKFVRDAVALMLGCDDGPQAPVLWKYGAEPGGAHGVRVELLPG